MDKKLRSLLRKLKILFNDFIITFITNISGPAGRKLRYIYWKRRFKRCGKNVVIDEGVLIQGAEWISIGDNVWIDKYCVLIAGAPDEKKSSRVFFIKDNLNYKFKRGELVIGNNVHIAPFCTIQAHGGVYIGNDVGIASGSRLYSLSHHYKNISDPTDRFEYKFTPMVEPEKQSLISAPVVIEDDCAIGLNCVVLPGTTIHKGTWIGVLGYVSGDIPGNSVYSSQPSKFLKEKISDMSLMDKKKE